MKVLGNNNMEKEDSKKIYPETANDVERNPLEMKFRYTKQLDNIFLKLLTIVVIIFIFFMGGFFIGKWAKTTDVREEIISESLTTPPNNILNEQFQISENELNEKPIIKIENTPFDDEVLQPYINRVHLIRLHPITFIRPLESEKDDLVNEMIPSQPISDSSISNRIDQPLIDNLVKTIFRLPLFKNFPFLDSSEKENEDNTEESKSDEEFDKFIDKSLNELRNLNNLINKIKPKSMESEESQITDKHEKDLEQTNNQPENLIKTINNDELTSEINNTNEKDVTISAPVTTVESIDSNSKNDINLSEVDNRVKFVTPENNTELIRTETEKSVGASKPEAENIPFKRFPPFFRIPTFDSSDDSDNTNKENNFLKRFEPFPIPPFFRPFNF